MQKQPRIYLTIATFYPLVGGAETQALAQAKSLRSRGLEATVLTFRHSSAWLRQEVMDGVPIVRIAGALLGRREKLPRIVQRLLYVLAVFVMGWTLWHRRREYNILHLYHLGMLALPAALACRLSKKPLLVAVRGASATVDSVQQIYSPTLSQGEDGAVSLIAGPLDPTSSWMQVQGRKRMHGDLEGLERLGKPGVRFTRLLLLRIQAVIVVLSSRMVAYLETYGFNLPGIQLIPNGVHTVHFAPSDEERDQVVICVSRLSYEKGIDVLLQAWHLVYRQCPEARLVIVGNGSLRAQLERMADELGIAKSVEFAGMQIDIPAQLHRGRLAVLPSRIEGMPNALLEAMACGLPCIATRVSGSEDIISDDVNGILVESEDYVAMADALVFLLRNPVVARQFGRAARKTIEQHYALEHIVDRYIDVYTSMLNERGHQGDQNLSFPLAY